VTLLNGIQHVAVIAVYLLYPLLVFRAIGTPTLLTANLLAIAMLVLGLGTFLQSLRIGPVGSGYMCPAVFTAVYLAPAIAAARTGGLSLVFGMTAFAGAVEAAVAPILHRLRAVFPPELSGLVLFVIGLSAAIAAIRSFLGAGAAPVTTAEWAVCGVTLGIMVALNIWGSGSARMLCTLLGVVVGYLAAAFAGLLSSDFVKTLDEIPWIGLPSFGHMSWSFDVTFALPFAIGSVAAAMKAAGTITLCQRANDSDWVRTTMRPVVGGVLADGASTFLAGLLGSIGTNTATGSAALASATGVTSRAVAFAVGGIFLALGFFPKLAGLLAVMPRAVIVGSLLFVNSFIMVNGLQIMTSRLLDARRTLMIALTVVGATAIEVFPNISTHAPRALASFVGSSLVFATVFGLALNLLFRIGVKKSVSLRIDHPDGAQQTVEDFFMKQAATWGARPDVIRRVIFAVIQLIEAVEENFRNEGPMIVTATFDEFNFDVRLAYKGEALEFPERRPSDEEIREDENGVRRLAAFMLRRNADRVRSEGAGGAATVYFHFDH
jgi:NCS2 family nucleobase:cation symporter-2